MRRRVLLLFIVVAIAGATGAAIGTGVVSAHDASAPTTALARADFADVAAPSALSRVRDQLGRDHDVRGDVTAALGIALVLTLSGGWWLARQRAARALHRRTCTTRRTRAPPMVTAFVHF